MEALLFIGPVGWNGYVKIVRTLLEKGVDLNMQNKVRNDNDNHDDDYNNGRNNNDY